MRSFKHGQRIVVTKPYPRKEGLRGVTGTVTLQRAPGVAWVTMDADIPPALIVHPETPRRILLNANECKEAPDAT